MAFHNSEDQLFTTNEFCTYLREKKINERFEDFELKYIAHTPKDGNGVIICEAQNNSTLMRIFKIWRECFIITFNFKSALINEELPASHSENGFWSRV